MPEVPESFKSMRCFAMRLVAMPHNHDRLLRVSTCNVSHALSSVHLMSSSHPGTAWCMISWQSMLTGARVSDKSGSQSNLPLEVGGSNFPPNLGQLAVRCRSHICACCRHCSHDPQAGEANPVESSLHVVMLPALTPDMCRIPATASDQRSHNLWSYPGRSCSSTPGSRRAVPVASFCCALAKIWRCLTPTITLRSRRFPGPQSFHTSVLLQAA